MFVLYCLKVQIDRLTYTLPLKLVQAAAPLEAPPPIKTIFIIRSKKQVKYCLFYFSQEGRDIEM